MFKNNFQKYSMRGKRSWFPFENGARKVHISLSLAPPSNETFSRTALSKNKMFVSATNRAERGVVQFRRLKTEVCTECSKKYDSKKISLKLISEQFNFALDSQLVKLSRLF